MCEVNKVVLFNSSSARRLSRSSPVWWRDVFLHAHFGNAGFPSLLWVEIKRGSNEQTFFHLRGDLWLLVARKPDGAPAQMLVNPQQQQQRRLKWRINRFCSALVVILCSF